jgi:hypothetical protein
MAEPVPNSPDTRCTASRHLVDALHELEAVLQQEQEHREEDEQEHDLLDAGHEALPSIRWLILMSCTVNTNDSTPQPMGRIAPPTRRALRRTWSRTRHCRASA